jgi:cell division protein FtsW
MSESRGRRTGRRTPGRPTGRKGSSRRPTAVSGAGSIGKVRDRARQQAPPIEYSILLTATVMLIAFGAVMIFSASSTATILRDGGLSDSVSFLTMTLVATVIGLVGLFLASRMPLDTVRKLTPIVLGGTLLLLLVVLAVGQTVNGTKGWLGVGPIQIQPAEFLKIAIVLYGAHLFANRPDRLHSIRELGPYLGMTAIACLLVLIQPDMGSALIAAAAAAITLIVAGAKLRDLGLVVASLVPLALLFAIVSPERRERLLTFLDPSADPTGAGYQVTQAAIAIGSGGVGGVGIGNSVQKALYLPEAHTDMILAVIGEEYGMIGIFLLVGVFGALAFAGFRIAKEARDDYGRILAAGLTGLIIFQASLNMYAVMGLAPLTGVPLPFVSYGNNSLVLMLVAVGLILNVARGGALSGSTGRRTGSGARLRVIQGAKSSSGNSRNGKAVGSAPGTDRGRRHGGARRAGPRRG